MGYKYVKGRIETLCPADRSVDTNEVEIIYKVSVGVDKSVFRDCIRESFDEIKSYRDREQPIAMEAVPVKILCLLQEKYVERLRKLGRLVRKAMPEEIEITCFSMGKTKKFGFKTRIKYSTKLIEESL